MSPALPWAVGLLVLTVLTVQRACDRRGRRLRVSLLFIPIIPASQFLEILVRQPYYCDSDFRFCVALDGSRLVPSKIVVLILSVSWCRSHIVHSIDSLVFRVAIDPLRILSRFYNGPNTQDASRNANHNIFPIVDRKMQTNRRKMINFIFWYSVVRDSQSDWKSGFKISNLCVLRLRFVRCAHCRLSNIVTPIKGEIFRRKLDRKRHGFIKLMSYRLLLFSYRLVFSFGRLVCRPHEIWFISLAFHQCRARWYHVGYSLSCITPSYCELRVDYWVSFEIRWKYWCCSQHFSRPEIVSRLWKQWKSERICSIV